VRCIFGDGQDRREIRMTVSEILSAGWMVESQTTTPVMMYGNQFNQYNIVFRKR
jgi:hypothetical protein